MDTGAVPVEPDAMDQPLYATFTMYVAPELEGVDPGEPVRNEDETDAEYEERRTLFLMLVSIPDTG